MTEWKDALPEGDNLTDKHLEEATKWLERQGGFRSSLRSAEVDVERRTRDQFDVLSLFGDLLLMTHRELLFVPPRREPPRNTSEGARRFLSARTFTTAWNAWNSVMHGYYLDAMTLIRVLQDALMYLRLWRKYPEEAERLWYDSGEPKHSLAKARQLSGARELFRDYDVLSAAAHSYMNALMEHSGPDDTTITVGPYWKPDSAEYCLLMFVTVYRNTLAEIVQDHPDVRSVPSGSVPRILRNIGSTLEKMGVADLLELD